MLAYTGFKFHLDIFCYNFQLHVDKTVNDSIIQISVIIESRVFLKLQDSRCTASLCSHLS